MTISFAKASKIRELGISFKEALFMSILCTAGKV
jgi:hypothetical protein